MSVYCQCQWKSPGRQDKPFTPFVLRAVSVYGHCKDSRGLCFINNSTALSSPHLDFPSAASFTPAVDFLSHKGNNHVFRLVWEACLKSPLVQCPSGQLHCHYVEKDPCILSSSHLLYMNMYELMSY